MRARLLSCLAVLVFATEARADEWTTTDTVMETTVLATFVLDYVQTRQLTADSREGNPIVGNCGGRVTEDGCGRMSPELYFGGLAIAHVIVMRALPHRWRSVAQGVTIGIQLESIHANYVSGYSFRF